MAKSKKSAGKAKKAKPAAKGKKPAKGKKAATKKSAKAKKAKSARRAPKGRAGGGGVTLKGLTFTDSSAPRPNPNPNPNPPQTKVTVNVTVASGTMSLGPYSFSSPCATITQPVDCPEGVTSVNVNVHRDGDPPLQSGDVDLDSAYLLNDLVVTIAPNGGLTVSMAQAT